MLTCYNNCPNDLGVGSVQQLRTLYCNNASVYGSTSSVVQVATSSSGTVTGATASATTAVQSGFASSTRSGSPASSTATATGTSGAGCVDAKHEIWFAAVGFAIVAML